MNKFIIGNLKSTLNEDNINTYVIDIDKNKYKNLIICPSYKYMHLFKSNNYILGSQDIDKNMSNYNIKYVIIGHYYRRSKYNEDDKIINNKVKYCIRNNFNVILCIGDENLNDRSNILNQISDCLDNISNKDLKNIILSYEPFNMIGNDIDIDIRELKDKINYIKDYLKQKYGHNFPLVYGGNVNSKNIYNILNTCDGVLLGRLSTNAKKLVEIVNNI